MKRFKSINIYVFDNLSAGQPGRMRKFGRLLDEKKITYYSYDTGESTNRCFPKAVVFRRFIDMMQERFFIRRRKGIELDVKDMYILSDNDMIYGPGFDEYFIPALDFVGPRYPTIHFLVKVPGGIPTRARKQGHIVEVPNAFRKDHKIKLLLAQGGGGSGCWVMDNNMLKRVRWANEDILKVFGKFKQHDTITWALIRRNQRAAPYVCGVTIDEEPEKPVLLHMGGRVGSICNSLTNNRYTRERMQFELKEEELASMSVNEIIEKYRGLIVW